MRLKWKLRSIMADKKITLKDLAEKLGLSVRAIQTLRSDNPSISISKLEQICNVLDCKVADLIEFIEDESNLDVNNIHTNDIISQLKESFTPNAMIPEDKVDEIVRKMVKGV